eukprot:CAMPEP_0178914500 /NCGR_PEP_ID=MMETSP0786-20121207/11462_1 /TAXON_ID=186022 /ORGANISM="Thalassionema frauenfeldii, Strain CCMP 1798" /LENGTH=396 /DNA_ID=CAMNT_0020587419 /DNA_START=151 /DNA_END=1338 /DNA_ORIENTATION=-
MEGSGHVSHLKQLAKESPDFYKYWDKTANDFSTRSDVRITSNREFGEAADLSVGYGFENPKDKFGPEIGFGWTMQDELQEEQILIIKCAKGGTHLGVEWQSPRMKQFNPDGYSTPGGRSFPQKKYGEMWDMTLTMVWDVVMDPMKYLPGVETIDGIEIAGVVFFQGWNDAFHDGLRNDYQNNLRYFITDILSTFGRTNEKPLPVIIGELGQEGDTPTIEKVEKIKMSQKIAIRELNRKNVVLAKTSPYVYNGAPDLDEGIHHYWGHADTIISIGTAFGQATLWAMGYTEAPTPRPSRAPSISSLPTASLPPSASPSNFPTELPTELPTKLPTKLPTELPSTINDTPLSTITSLKGSDSFESKDVSNVAFYMEIAKSKAATLRYSMNASLSFSMISI